MRIEINVKESKKLTVGRHGKQGTSGRIFVPKSWVGEDVLVCLLEERR